MSSDKKIAANQNNSKKSPGPTTNVGKQRSKRNATKHGVLAVELVVDEQDKLEFETLRSDLRDQLAPATPLQNIGFERILGSIWRSKLAVRLDAKRLKVTFDQFEQRQNLPQKDAPPENILPTQWYGASGADLRTAIQLLSRLRQDVESNGWIHADDWKPSVIRAFGEEFFSLLTDWVPMNVDAIHMARMVVDHAERYNLPLRPAGPEKNQLIVDPNLSWQLGIKLIDLTRQHLESLARIGKLNAEGNGQEHRASALELATRYFTSATRELERSVEWYQFLKGQGL